MRRVQQENGTGCGLAVVAMVAGKKYEEVRTKAEKVLHDSEAHPNGFGHKRNYRTTKSDLRTLAGAYDLQLGRKVNFEHRIRHQPRKISSFFNNYMAEKNIGSHAIVATHRKPDGEWHWVVWDNEKCKILDPRKEPRDTIRPWYYLPVC